jgi:hypothetical protein
MAFGRNRREDRMTNAADWMISGSPTVSTTVWSCVYPTLSMATNFHKTVLREFVVYTIGPLAF